MYTATFLSLALPLAAPQLKGKPAPDPLLGRWAATSMVINLKPDPQWRGLEYEFTTDGRWVICSGGQEQPDATRSYVVDRKAKPPSIDLTELGRDPYPGVYQVGPDGDTLTVSFPIAGGRARPTGIEPAPGTMTISFKKATKER